MNKEKNILEIEESQKNLKNNKYMIIKELEYLFYNLDEKPNYSKEDKIKKRNEILKDLEEFQSQLRFIGLMERMDFRFNYESDIFAELLEVKNEACSSSYGWEVWEAFCTTNAETLGEKLELVYKGLNTDEARYRFFNTILQLDNCYLDNAKDYLKSVAAQVISKYSPTSYLYESAKDMLDEHKDFLFS
jgi:hypothetical protein